ncbi:MAG: nucleotidyltransferase domain-containing protein [Spirochaetaceae bacterium]|nr:nucleotidyltransferase domain-containing protein [Spirochaetaceae bacterium]
MTEFGLTEAHRSIISAIFAQYPQIKTVVVYGSRAKGTHRPGSDIDMTITAGEDLSTNLLLKLINDFDDSLLPFLVDLSICAQLTEPALLDHIQRVGRVIYQREE